MVIFPAIDIINGNVVRLFKGDYNSVEKYGENPENFALEFYNAGARHLHLVDLDGAKSGKTENFSVLLKIKNKVPGLFVEIGGGIRNESTVYKYLEAGAGRVILGTAALKEPNFVKDMVHKYGEKIAVGVDAKDGFVATEGWLNISKQKSVDFCRIMLDNGVEYIIYTDISRDGAMQGANLEIYKELNAIKGLNITASGGVSSLDDIRALNEMNLYAAILGKALYKGIIKLEDAIKYSNVN